VTGEFADDRLVDASHGEVTHERTPKVMQGAWPDAGPLDGLLEAEPYVVWPRSTLIRLSDELALRRQLPSWQPLISLGGNS